MIRPTRLLAGTVALGAALALSACGSGTTTAPSTAAPGASSAAPAGTSAAPAATPDAKPAPADGTALAQRMADAMVAAKSGKMAMTMKVDVGAAVGNTTAAPTTMSSKGEFVMNGSQMDTHATMDLGGRTMEVISTGGMMYLKMPGMTPGGKPWVKIDPNGTDPLSKQMGPQIKNLGDPRAQTEQYKGAQVTVVGKQGDLTEYQLTNITGLEGGELRVWLDGKDRPIKQTITSKGVTGEVTYSDWGAPVTITPPPADQVGTAS